MYMMYTTYAQARKWGGTWGARAPGRQISKGGKICKSLLQNIKKFIEIISK